ncbi:uncharacterized protein EV422DRAFT_430194 [Fimicolochytrium jonesii]|uniref:uncharacterized protein n=1 Tax=Fimicolochytrium jonesii TaxID=1396493 RepID=UPI0022FE4FAB|nr:uncharacterized protein EV422DRAFT_430194 [Fimicolochytrium jonesii]KAI8821741.1 hypothetical protein EV422DRAFT_430194 [Fimicolochytrium jonesii]
MDSTATSTSKKRPQETERSASPSTTSTAATSTSTPSKKAKHRHIEHHVTCTDDPNCRGCSAGEVVITFTATPDNADGNEGGDDASTATASQSDPSAAQLYRMALQEREDLENRRADIKERERKKKAATNSAGNESAGAGATAANGTSATFPTTTEDGGGKDEQLNDDEDDLQGRRKVVIKLFELAIDKFEAETRVPATTPRTEKPAFDFSTGSPTDTRELGGKLMFGSCLLDFGSFFPLPEYIERSVDLFSECVAFLETDQGTAARGSWGAGAALFGLARAKMELLRNRYETMADADEEAESDDSDDSDEEDKRGGGNAAGKPSAGRKLLSFETEDTLIAEAKTAVDKGLALVSRDKDAFVVQCVSAALLFRGHAQLQRERYVADSTRFTKTFTTALHYLNEAQSAHPQATSFHIEALEARGACLYYLAAEQAAQLDEDEDEDEEPESETEGDKKDGKKGEKDGKKEQRRETLEMVHEAETALRVAIKICENAKLEAGKHVVPELHLLAQTLLLRTNLESDESKTMELFHEAVVCLRRAFELDPDNEEIHSQLEQMGVFDETSGSESGGSAGGESDGEE